MRTPDLTSRARRISVMFQSVDTLDLEISFFYFNFFNFGGCVHYTYAYNKIFFLTDPIYDNYIFVLCIFKEDTEAKVFLWVWFVRISISFNPSHQHQLISCH